MKKIRDDYINKNEDKYYDNEKKDEKKDEKKFKPDFGLSGALASDVKTGNVYKGVVLKVFILFINSGVNHQKHVHLIKIGDYMYLKENQMIQ